MKAFFTLLAWALFALTARAQVEIDLRNDTDVVDNSALITPLNRMHGAGLVADISSSRGVADGEAIIYSELPRPVNVGEINRELMRSGAIHPSDFPRIEVEISLDEYGDYQSHLMLTPISPEIAAVFHKFLPRLRYTPAIRDNEPVRATIIATFRFPPVE